MQNMFYWSIDRTRSCCDWKNFCSKSLPHRHNAAEKYIFCVTQNMFHQTRSCCNWKNFCSKSLPHRHNAAEKYIFSVMQNMFHHIRSCCNWKNFCSKSLPQRHSAAESLQISGKTLRGNKICHERDSQKKNLLFGADVKL